MAEAAAAAVTVWRSGLATAAGRVLPSRPSLFTISEPRNQEIGRIYEVQERRATDFEVAKGRSGSSISLSFPSLFLKERRSWRRRRRKIVLCEMCHSQQTGRLRSTTTTTSISGSSIQYTIHRMCVRFRLKVQFIYFPERERGGGGGGRRRRRDEAGLWLKEQGTSIGPPSFVLGFAKSLIRLFFTALLK